MILILQLICDVRNDTLASAAIISLTISTVSLPLQGFRGHRFNIIFQVNIAVLTILKGEEFGWACLSSCVTDVCIDLTLGSHLFLLMPDRILGCFERDSYLLGHRGVILTQQRRARPIFSTGAEHWSLGARTNRLWTRKRARLPRDDFIADDHS